MLVVDLPAFHFTEILLRKESNQTSGISLKNMKIIYTMIYDIEIKPMKFQSPKIPV